jgi:hypothetical protein
MPLEASDSEHGWGFLTGGGQQLLWFGVVPRIPVIAPTRRWPCSHADYVCEIQWQRFWALLYHLIESSVPRSLGLLHSATTWARRARLWFRATRSLVRNVPAPHLRYLWDFTMPGSRPTGDNNRYSEIRRALWRARFEAGSSHSVEIRLEHLLLGTLP